MALYVHVVRLLEERNCLRRDIDSESQKCRLLLEIAPALRSKIDQLQQMVELYNAEVQEACTGWEARCEANIHPPFE